MENKYIRTNEFNVTRNIHTKDRKEYNRLYMQLYRLENAEKIKANVRRNYEINGDKYKEKSTWVRKYLAKYYKEHKEEILAEYDNYIKNKN